MEEELKQATSNCLRIVLFGPESTGKTTLAKQLAAHYKTNWVPEFMREYLQKKWDETKERCTKDDLIPIAKGQMKSENLAISKLNSASKGVGKLLFCDTNLLEIKVYSEYYYNGFCPQIIEEQVIKNNYDFYFVTNIDVPWEIDDLRDRPDEREEIFRNFVNELTNYNLPHFVLSGSQDLRLKTAIKVIDNLLKEN